MRRRSQGRRITAVAVVLLGLVAVAGPASAQATGHSASARAEEPLPLEQLFDNTAVSDDTLPASADFDGSGASLSASDLTSAGWTPGRALTVQGADLTWPARRPGEPDNVRAAGQSVLLTGTGDALAFLVTATGGTAVSGSGTVSYADGSSSAYRLTAPDWRTGPLATKAVTLPHVNTPTGQLTTQARLYVVTVPIAPGREVVSVRLPSAAGLHVFALTVRAKSAGWTGSWSASTSGYPAVGPWTDRTLRLVVHTSAGGPRVRLRFDNTFAAAPVRIGSATVAVQSAGATARDVPVALSFGGAAGVEVPAGAQAFTDPLGFEVPADANLLVSFHLPDTVAAVAEHRLAKQRSYLSTPGDHTADSASTAYTTTLTTWPLLTGVDVSGGPGSLVLLGDSITDGAGSTTDSNRRWPNALATRLLAQSAVPRYGVLNQGISGNRVVAEIYHGEGISTDSTGVDALNRLDRDVLAQTSVRTVIVFEGINDVRWQATAAQVVAGLREIAERGHERGLRMLVATILPCAGEARCTAAVDTQRVAVNAWIRANDVFDGVLDFDTALRDPGQPARLLPAYDGGDHLHPGETGLAALAGAVDLTLL
ncbi:GDSL-type esterase/lipase family protein [Streptomyces sp. NPDC092369]|uniref:GDSL-type esterase/lipase family protein n=1 Tax=Streptomyces sp. NPDC092369 TaxID=3366015 RepID=UPI0038157661